MRIIRLLPIGVSTMIIACGGDGTSGPTPPPPPTPVASVSLTPTSADLQVGQTRQLTAQPRDADGNSLSRTVSWQSSSAAVATVSSSGLVTAVSAGTAQITATSEGKSAGAAITVKPAVIAVASVGVTPATAEIEVGETSQLTAAVLDAQGKPLTGRSVAWASTAPAVATVSASGLVTAVTPGTASITATSEGKTGQATVTVLAIPVASVSVEPTSGALIVGETMQLSATARSADDEVLTGRSVAWSSSNATIASVSASGLVTAVAAGGPVTITATIEGQSASAAISVVPDGALVQVVTGFYHTCGLTGAGDAWCWGRNDHGQAGIGVAGTPITTPIKVITATKFTQLTNAWASTCGLDAAGKVWCWGVDDYGSVGDGSNDTWLQPTPLRGNFTFTQIVGNDEAYCGITTAQEARCWGDGSDGQLGNGDWLDAGTPVLVAGGHQWQQLARGVSHTCGLTTGGKAYCWGASDEGEVGDPAIDWVESPVPVTGNHTFVQISAGDWHTCALKANGEAWCWGYNIHGQVGDGSNTDRATPVRVIGSDAFTAIVASGWANCGLLANGQLKCWGSNSDGELGDATQSNRSQPGPVGGGHVFSRLSEGSGYHFCAQRIDGVVLCWGWNEYGQLGNASYNDASLPTPIAELGQPTIVSGATLQQGRPSLPGKTYRDRRGH